MSKHRDIATIQELVLDLQHKVNIRDINCDFNSARFSCDLLLRNMNMILSLHLRGESIEKELGYLRDNLVASYSQLTGKDVETIAKKYDLKIYL
jgi:hypothetical protein